MFRGGFLVPPEEAQVLTDRARSTAESGPYVGFKDDNHPSGQYQWVIEFQCGTRPNLPKATALLGRTHLNHHSPTRSWSLVRGGGATSGL